MKEIYRQQIAISEHDRLIKRLLDLKVLNKVGPDVLRYNTYMYQLGNSNVYYNAYRRSWLILHIVYTLDQILENASEGIAELILFNIADLRKL